jgi:hypothetical protein
VFPIILQEGIIVDALKMDFYLSMVQSNDPSKNAERPEAFIGILFSVVLFSCSIGLDTPWQIHLI